jgi:acyl-CoA thioesterase I
MKKSTRRQFIVSASIAGLLTPVFKTAGAFGINHSGPGNTSILKPGEKDEYLAEIKIELIKEWPKNRIINLVFHGHSVPSGYFKTPDVKPFQSYPFLLLKDLKKTYPFAVINIILTCMGGENSQQGAKRFKRQVLNHRPDVLFIDYALNDTGIGIAASRKAMEYMIREALRKKIKIILLTPTPDQRVDILNQDSDLQKLSNQVIDLSKEYQTGLVDNYTVFQKLVSSGENITGYMSQVNHPNENGHQLIVDGIMKYY